MQSKRTSHCLLIPFQRAFAVVTLCLLGYVASAAASVFYVATNGADTNPGTSNSPFATLMRAQSAAAAGDTICLRGGTYFLDNSHITTTNNPWIVVNNINRSGISYVAFPGERPAFDFSGVRPVGYRVTAFLITSAANDCVFKGFEVVGVQITITNRHTQSECFRVAGGSRNRFEQLAMHDGMGNGWYLTSGSSNLVLNCDAYNNRGLDIGSLGNIDGFGCHPNSASGKGNVFRGCRAWFNSDDGYDCINAFAPVTFENCWAFYNGFLTNFSSSTGDGNGFKSGGYGVSGGSVPDPVPRHATRFCLALGNRANGFYANHHPGGLDWVSNTAFRNGVNFNMLCNLDAQSPANDVPGFNHMMKNNLGCQGNAEVSNLGPDNDASYNYFTLPVTVTADDFMTLEEVLLTAPRQPNGDLPYIAFAQLVGTSDLVNAGTNTGYAFAGTAPDLGAFEYGIKPPPTLAVTRLGESLVFTVTGGPAGGTNYLIATTNLALGASQWTPVATNRFDAPGNSAITSSIPVEVPQRFNRLRLP